ncbi:hypothetical protein KN1_28250 [Stygiolobus caldivivus]|uniref:DNA methylase n=1 Tax=Stygiolobus caldivivus TaxID=2824673 RepID=A0A8D5U9V3_9CREN|nr:hypothetical protein KN1_28250 [Stygiolobus caldivivus]
MLRLLDDLKNYIPVVEKLILEKEKGGIKREVSLHRWWSKRYIYLYRSILASFLLENDEKFYEALINPEILDAHGLTYFEPLAGGGTGLVEASLYNYNAYGIDINPLAVKIIEGYSALRNDVNFNHINSIIEEAKKELSPIWSYKGSTVSYVLITRDKVPSWVMTKKNPFRKVILCPHCGNFFESESNEEKVIPCPHCGNLVEVTIKPLYKPKNVVDYFGWKAFGIVVDKTLLFDKNWLENRNRLLKEVELEVDIDIYIEELREGNRLIKANITRPEKIFTKAQLLTFHRLAERAKELSQVERLLLMLAASDSVKTCSLLCRWYPPLNEPVPYAGGIKGYWVPEYTVETNPLAVHARSTVISGIRNQMRIRKYKLRGEIHGMLGDALVKEYPKSDLIVIDPPYYKLSPSYSSLSFPHIVIINLFERISLKSALNKEIGKERYFDNLLTILKKSKESLKSDGRIVLIINMKSEWKNLYEVIEKVGLEIVNKYEILGESPGYLGRSQHRTNIIFILRPI